MLFLVQLLMVLTMSSDEQKVKVEANYSAKEKRVTLCVKNDADKPVQFVLFRQEIAGQQVVPCLQFQFMDTKNQVISKNEVHKDGYWNPLALSSSFTTSKKKEFVELSPKSKISFSVDVSSYLSGTKVDIKDVASFRVRFFFEYGGKVMQIDSEKVEISK